LAGEGVEGRVGFRRLFLWDGAEKQLELRLNQILWALKTADAKFNGACLELASLVSLRGREDWWVLDIIGL